MKKKIGIIKNAIVAALIIALSIYILMFIFFPKMASNIIGYKFYTILTDSMNPVIPPGSFVLSKTVKEDTKLDVGDIITFEGNRFGELTIFTHYLKKIEVDETGQKQYITKGNTATEYDPYTTYRDDIKGVYVFHIPYLGKVIEFLRSPIGLLEIAVICLLLLNQHFLGGYFDAQDRLILNIKYQKKLQLRKVKVKMKEDYLKVTGILYNPPKGTVILPCLMQVELLGKEEETVETEQQLLSVISAGEQIPWECETTQGKLIEDYRITIVPIKEEETEQNEIKEETI